MKKLNKHLLLIIAILFFLSGCAGNNNTITINQAPNVEKASETKVDAAGSGYGSVTK